MMRNIKAVFSSRYAGSVDYYAAMLRFGCVGICGYERYNKRNKHLNRMEIAGTNGIQTLSVPLSKPNGSMKVSEVGLSEHGNWRHIHWGALFSAYGRTPFFDYFADDLKRIYEDRGINTVFALNMALHYAIIDFLDLPVETVVLDGKIGYDGLECVDARDSIADFTPSGYSYYQIWQDRYGFQKGMSMLDLLFNEGREAILYLLKINGSIMG